jgi:ABC-type maltose transport system permease subunit
MLAGDNFSNPVTGYWELALLKLLVLDVRMKILSVGLLFLEFRGNMHFTIFAAPAFVVACPMMNRRFLDCFKFQLQLTPKIKC